MSQILLCNDLNNMAKICDVALGTIRYLNLEDSVESYKMVSTLRNEYQSEEIDKARILRTLSQDFRRQFVNTMGRLNSHGQSRDWLAMSFTSKNAFSTPLCKEMAHFLLIVDLCKRSNQTLLVITNSKSLAAQIQEWSIAEHIEIINKISELRPVRELVKKFTPAGVLRSAARITKFWLASRQFRNLIGSTDNYIVIATHTHPRSFTKDSQYQDAYFGELLTWLTDAEKDVKGFILGFILENPNEQMKKLRHQKFAIPVVPLQTWFTFKDLLCCVWKALDLYIRPVNLPEQAVLAGIDVSLLVKRSIIESRNTGDFLFNSHVYYCAKRLGEKVQVNRCLYPFENRSWEKMLLTGIRASSPGTLMVGYQHTSLTPSHTNFLLGKGESDLMPLPDSIVTTGRIPKEWLEAEGSYPDGIFKSACALRSGQGVPRTFVSRRARSSKILVVLATSLEEYIGTLLFLDRSFANTEEFCVRIRPHPALFPLKKALDLIQLEDESFFTESTNDLVEDLLWSDIVIYGSSTVCLEALSLGLPVIYLDLGFFLNTDPLYGWSKFKWIVDQPTHLIQAIYDVDRLSDEEFGSLQLVGKEYSAEYLSPADKKHATTFLRDS